MHAARTALLLTLLGSLLPWPLASADAERTLAPVYARFLLRRPGHASEPLVLVRTSDRVEYRYGARQTFEVWRRDARGGLEHVKAFAREGKLVRYTDGDLRSISLVPSWPSLASLIDRDTLSAGAKRRPAGRFQGERAEWLTGRLGASAVRVAWLPEIGLPARLELSGSATSVRLELLELAPCSAELCAASDEQALTSIDFADLGDREHDPFVRRFLAQEHAHSSALVQHVH